MNPLAAALGSATFVVQLAKASDAGLPADRAFEWAVTAAVLMVALFFAILAHRRDPPDQFPDEEDDPLADRPDDGWYDPDSDPDL